MDKFWIITSGVFVLGMLIMSLRDRRYLLFGYIISLPWFGLYLVFSLTISPDRIFAFAMLVYILLNLKKLEFPQIYKNILYFIGWTVIITLFFVIFAPVSTYDYSLLRGNYRWVPQVFTYFLYIVPIFYAAITIKDQTEIRKLFKMFIVSVSIVAILGLVQFVYWRISGTDIFPIYMLQQNVMAARTTLLNVNGATIIRICSLGGEPKHLAYSLVLGLSMVMIEIIYKGFKPFLIFLFTLFTTVFLLTFSTQGYILLAVNVIILFIAMIFSKRRILFKRSIVFICLAGLAVGIFFHYFPSYFDLSKDRSTGRILDQSDPNDNLGQSSGLFLLQSSDETILNFLKDQPIFAISGVGLGNIHIRAQDYVPEYSLNYIFLLPLAAENGALRFISDIGIIGLILFLLAYLTPITYLRRLDNRTNTEEQFLIIALIILVDVILTIDGPNYFSFAMAIGYLLFNLRLKESISKDPAKRLSEKSI